MCTLSDTWPYGMHACVCQRVGASNITIFCLKFVFFCFIFKLSQICGCDNDTPNCCHINGNNFDHKLNK